MMSSPLSLSSRSSSRSSSFSDVSRSDEPCQAAFAIGETVWARVGPTWHVGLVISPEYQKSFAPYLPTVRTWDIAIISPAHPAGVHTTPLSPALGHLKPATPAVLGVLQHEGLVPRAWVYGAPELTCQVYELHKRLGAAGIPF